MLKLAYNGHMGITYLALAACLFNAYSSVCKSQDEIKGWAWERKAESGCWATRPQLDWVLERHFVYAGRLLRGQLSPSPMSGPQGDGRADLAGADLSGAELSGAELSGAELSGAKLERAKLAGAKLREADVSRANLRHADLSGETVLIDTNLSGAILASADLRGADLYKADLNGADMIETDLRGADLSAAKLSKSLMFRADVRDAIYEVESHPRLDGISFAQNLDHLKVRTDLSKIVELRKLLKENGYFDAAKQVNAAIRRNSNPTWAETLFLDYPCEFGANVSRPLWLIAFLWILFSLFYQAALFRFPRTESRAGIYVIATRGSRTQAMRISRIWLKDNLSSWMTALLFSAMSAFNIGFRGFNFGRWIRLLQPREFDLKALGWPRTVAGVQSLLGVYLLALAILSYLGTPFEK